MSEVIHDCDYWRRGKDDAEKAKRAGGLRSDHQGQAFDRADRAMAYAERAGFAGDKGRSDDAIADFDQASRFPPIQMDWRRDRGMLLHFKGEQGRAIEEFDKILAADPSNGAHHFLPRLVVPRQGRRDARFCRIGKGIELAPEASLVPVLARVEHAKRGQRCRSR